MEILSIAGHSLPVYGCGTLVVGAGAAGLNAADELLKHGQNVLLAADDFTGGTSRNAGSDKQTYYKLSLSGEPDSVEELARAYFSGGHMDGDTALALAAGSAEGFLKLVQLGVPFPHNVWGEYVGYRTDHDPRSRATSAGPLTSRFMAERLAVEAELRGVSKVQGTLVGWLTSGGRLCGALFYDTAEADGPSLGFFAVRCGQAVACTGGAALLYEDSVFPAEQAGALGASLRAGAAGQNLWSWQYGLASVKKRWNVSGSYQQVLPRYTDEAGQDVLEEVFSSEREKLDNIFLKGYQWPFDKRKLAGSSRVDERVARVTAQGRRVYLDFRKKDPEGWLDLPGEEARQYLIQCSSVQDTPFERLMRMNPAAVDLYRSFGIDLETEPLEVKVCAQHMNGGLAIDRSWQSTLPGLYAAGETAGAFGAYRPGGSALNETQVGSSRAAKHISSRGNDPDTAFSGEALEQIAEELRWFTAPAEIELADARTSLQRRMSRAAGAVRSVEGMRALAKDTDTMLAGITRGAGGAGAAISLRDSLYAARGVLSAMLLHAEELGTDAGHTSDGPPPRHTLEDAAGYKVVTQVTGTAAASFLAPVRPLPEAGGWFETVWRDYREGKIDP